MSALARIVLALLALGMQLPVKLVVPLCLCEFLPVLCPAGGDCAVAERTSSCCSASPSSAEPGGATASEEQPASCCGCELALGGADPAPTGPAPEGGAGPLLNALGAALVAAPATIRMGSIEPAARPPDRAGAAINRPLRI